MAHSNPYADYIESARSRIDFGDIEEIAMWKREIIEGLRPALDAVRAGTSDWPSLVIKGVSHEDDIVDWRAFDPLRKWFRSGSDDALHGWLNGDDDAFLAFGEDPQDLPVYRVTGSVKRPTSLSHTRLRFPGCLRFMPYAEPVLDLKRISKAQARRWRTLIRTPESYLGP
ncbi:MAG: hypothetical protein OXC06_02685 [Acidimicrobiaceae bacterium]|nr:hypothetical protein [Acidimicrobiaceae bacterium]